MEEGTDPPGSGAESPREAISSMVHPSVLYPLDSRCSCSDDPHKTLTRPVKVAEVWGR